MGGYTIELIALGEHGDRLWKFHCASEQDAVRTMDRFARHLNDCMRKLATPPDIRSGLHSLFHNHGVSCPCTELGKPDTLLVHLYRHMTIKSVEVEAYYPCVVAWSRHIDYHEPIRCHLCHQSIDAVRHVTKCCFRSYCHQCIADWGRFHTQCPSCGSGMHFYTIR